MVVATLALGIGANTTLFGIVDAAQLASILPQDLPRLTAVAVNGRVLGIAPIASIRL